MTTFAQGSRQVISYVSETTYGVTPATPTFVAIPVASFNINPTIDQLADNSIRSDRQTRYSLTGNTHITGDFDVNLNNHNFDPFFASLLTGAWSTNILKFGNLSAPSFTFEAGATDISEYFQYTGVVMDKLSLSVSTTGVVTAKFSVIGKGVTLTSATAATTLTPVTEHAPFTHIGGTFKEGGSITALISNFTLNIDNKTTGNFTLGGNTTQNLASGMVQVAGTAGVMFADAVIANKFLQGTPTSFDFTLTDGTNTIEITCPNVKYTGMTRQVSGQGPITLNVAFTALYDSGSSSTLTITRSS